MEFVLRHQWLIYPALLLWGALAADLASNPDCSHRRGAYIAGMVLMVGIIALSLWHHRNATAWRVGIIAVGYVTLITHHPAVFRQIELLAIVAMFALGEQAHRLRPAAIPAGLIYAGLVWFTGGNTNVQAIALVALLFLAPRKWWFVAVMGLVIVTRHSEAALIAVAVGLTLEYRPKLVWWGIPVTLAVVAIKWHTPSVQHRLGMLEQAFGGGFLGNGLYAYNYMGYTTPHNIIAEVYFVAGIVGLAALAGVGWWLWINRAQLGPWFGLVGAIGVLSLLDAAYLGFGGALAALALGNVSATKWLNYRRYRDMMIVTN